MDLIRSLADRLISLSAFIGTLGLATIVLVILVDVIGRAMGSPLFGSQDMITMASVILVFGGMALCDRGGGHLSVDILDRYFPSWMNRFIDALSALTGAVIFVTMGWALYNSALISEMLNLSTNLLRLPKAWFQYAAVGFCIMTAAGMALRAVELALGVRDVRLEGAPEK